MELSSNSLYHFTNEYDNIESILTTGFRYSQLKESLPLSTYAGSPFAIKGIIDYLNTPKAVCFCDIPLEFCNNHKEQYGTYVIALSKVWGMRKGITPIRYIHYHSPDINNDSYRMLGDGNMLYPQYNNIPFYFYLEMLINQGEIERPSEENFDNIPDYAMAVIKNMGDQLISNSEYIQYAKCFLRNYEGEWIDRVTKNKVIRRFYDEREWRHVNHINSKDNLTFELEDVVNIIVNDEMEKNRILEYIINNFSKENSQLIESCIIQWKEIPTIE